MKKIFYTGIFSIFGIFVSGAFYLWVSIFTGSIIPIQIGDQYVPPNTEWNSLIYFFTILIFILIVWAGYLEGKKKETESGSFVTKKDLFVFLKRC